MDKQARPPSHRPVMRTAAMSVSPLEISLAALVWITALGALAAGEEPAPAADGPHRQPVAQQPAAPPADAQPADGVDRDWAERQAIWNSPPMQYALGWLQEYFRTSRQSPPEVEQAYLDRLTQLSAEELRVWLEQFLRQHRQTAVEGQRFAAVRRQSVADAAALKTARTAAPRPTGGGGHFPNYVQTRSSQRPFNSPVYSPVGSPLRSLQIVNYLDTLEVLDYVRDVRRSGR